ncbi:transposable element Tc1 transposase [Trichonephila clavipes]|nr:transposable element Tc1 transposase [Trichonephila clavipes]
MNEQRELQRIGTAHSAVPITSAHCQARLQWYLSRTGWNHADWGRFSFQLCPNKRRRRAWRRPGQRAGPAFHIAGHTGPQQGVIVWGAISFEVQPL